MTNNNDSRVLLNAEIEELLEVARETTDLRVKSDVDMAIMYLRHARKALEGET